LRRLARRIDEARDEPVCAVVESMTGARLVHDTLEQEGWDVEIADAEKVKGLAPLGARGHDGKLVRWRLRPGRSPRPVTLCVPLGNTRPRSRC
jgi:hypothetical protein